MDTLPDQLVSSHEIAVRLGVKPQTVWQWVARGVLPEPWGSWGAPGKQWRLWEWSAVEQWAKATGRAR